MADSVLNIKIKAFLDGLDQIKTLTAQVNQLSASLEAAGKTDSVNSLNKQVGQLANTLNSTAKQASSSGIGKNMATGLGEASLKTLSLKEGLSSLTEEFLKLNPVSGVAEKGLSSLKDQVKDLVLGFMALAGIKLSFDYLKEAADTAARTETLGVTLKIVGNNAGYTDAQLNEYEKSLKKLGITTQSARDSMTQMIQAGLPLGPVMGSATSNVERLARASQDLAVVTGQNSSDTFRRLITNIQQLDTMGLRFMGLTVNIQEAEQRFATSIGKTAAALNQQQKVQAVNNAVLQEAAKLQGAYEASMDTVGKKVQSLARYKEELANAIGEKLLPAYGAAVDAATRFLSESEKSFRSIDRFGNSAKDIGDGTKAAFSGIGDFASSLVTLFGQIYESIGPLIAELGEVVRVVFDAGAMFLDLINAIHLVPFAIRLVEVAVAGLLDGLKVVSMVGVEAVGLLLEAFGSLGEVGAKIVGVFDKEMGDSLMKVSSGAKKMGQDLQGTAGEMFQSFADGNSEIQRVISSIVDMDRSLNNVGKASNFKDIQADVMALKREIKANHITSVEAGVAIGKLGANIDDLGKKGALTGDQITELRGQLAGIAGDESKKAGESFKNIGITAIEATSGISEKFGQVSGSLNELVENFTVSAEQIRGAFSHAVDTAKTIEEFASLSNAVDNLKKRIESVGSSAAMARYNGDMERAKKLSEEEAALQTALEETLGRTGLAYGAVVTASLKVAKSQSELDRAAAQSEQSFKSGMISAAQYAETMKRVADRREDLSKALSAPITSDALTSLGTSLKTLSTGISEEGAKIIADLDGVVKEGALKGEALGRYFAEAFKKSKTPEEIDEISKHLQKAANDGKLTGDALELASQAGASSFGRLSDASVKSADSVDALQREATRVGDAFVSGAIKADEMAVRMQLIANRTKELDNQENFKGLDLGLQQVGMSANEVLNGVSKGAGQIDAAFAGLNATAGMSSDQIYTAFNGIITKANVLGDLESVRRGLDSLAASGKLSGETLEAANARVGVSFRTLFEKDLKSAKTVEDFTLLEKKVMDLGANGVISGNMVTASLRKIHDAMAGVSSLAVATSNSVAAIASAQEKVASAQTNVAQKGLNLAKAQTSLVEARNRAEREGTEEARENVRVKEQAVRLAQAEKTAAEAALDSEIAGLRKIQAEQEKIIALKKMELNPSEANQVSLDIAERKVAAAEKEYNLKKAAQSAANEDVSKSQEALAVEEQRLEVIKQQNLQKGGGSGGSGDAPSPAPDAQSEYEKVRVRPAGALTPATTANGYKILGELLDSDIQQALGEAGYGDKAIKEFQNTNRQLKDTGLVSGITDWDRVFQGMSTSKKMLDEMIQKSKDAAAEANQFAQNYNTAGQSIKDAELGISGMIEKQHGAYDSSGKIAEQYNSIRRSAAEAAKSMVDSVRSYASSMNDLSAQLASAQGDEEKAAAIRMRSKRQEMDVQYQMMQTQIAVARAQAQAAGINTSGIDRASADAAAAYHAGKAASEKLYQIEVKNIRAKRAEESKANAEKVSEQIAGASQVSAAAEDSVAAEKGKAADTARQAEVLSLAAVRERLAEEKKVTSERQNQLELAKTDSMEALMSQISGAVVSPDRAASLSPNGALRSSTPQTQAQKLAAGVLTQQNSGTNSTVVEIKLGSKSAKVLTDNKDDLLTVLEELSKVAS